MTKILSYKDSGVDVEKGDAFVKRIKKLVGALPQKCVYQGIGGFAALYKRRDGLLLAAATDGVGTKLKIAQLLNKHDTIGIDLVAMCVNDILCTGAVPLFFLDYLSCGKLDIDMAENIMKGIVDGCEQADMALIGGETAEMPGMYGQGEYDLAGFCVGEVSEDQIINEQGPEDGMEIIGLSSSGLHSNGFSLVRALIDSSEEHYLRDALTPTRIYLAVVKELKDKGLIQGLAHITGGGFSNITRISKRFNYRISFTPSFDEISPLFKILAERSRLPREKLYQTFNMGVGLVVLSRDAESVCQVAGDFNIKSWRLGEIAKGTGDLNF